MTSLKQKTLTILLLSMGTFLGCLSYFGLGVLLDGFRTLEQSETLDQTTRIRNRVDGELTNIAVKLADWAAWDDLWKYADNRSEEFAKSNLPPFDALSNLSLNLLLILDMEHKLITGLQNDAAGEKALDVTPKIIATATSTSPFSEYFLKNVDPDKFTAGIYQVDGVQWLIAARPITTGDKKGVIRGFILFGRELTNSLIESWSRDLKMEFNLNVNPDALTQTADPNQTNIRLQITPSTMSSWFESDIRSHTWFEDFEKKNAFALEAHFPRVIMRQGLETILTMGGIVSLATLFITLIIMYSLQKVVLDRVKHLQNETHKIAKSNNNYSRITINGKDEIADLGESVNFMMGTIEERTSQVRDIMENASFGLFIANLNGEIQQGYTQSCRDLLGIEVVGLSFADALDVKGDSALLMTLLFEQLIDDFVPAEVTLNQLPKRLVCRGKTIALTASPLRDKTGKVDRMLVSLTDATHVVEVEHENEDNKVTLRILKIRTGFVALLTQLKLELLAMNAELPENGQIGVRMRLHTLNGNLRCFGLSELTNLVGRVESKDLIAAADLNGIESAITNWVTRHEGVLGISWDQSSHDAIHEVPESVLGHLESASLFSPSLTSEAKEFIYNFTNYTRSKTMNELLTPLVALTSDVSMRLGKKVSLSVVGGDIRVHPVQFQPIFDVLPHLIRNAIDHGIEDAATRAFHKKSEVASISLLIKSVGDHKVELTLRDDGVGIDPDKIGSIAISNTICTEAQIKNLSSREKTALILLPGFSTRSEITEISGRGIGMGAVHNIVVNDFGGEFEIDSVLGHGTSIRLAIPLQVIDLPRVKTDASQNSTVPKSKVA